MLISWLNRHSQKQRLRHSGMMILSWTILRKSMWYQKSRWLKYPSSNFQNISPTDQKSSRKRQLAKSKNTGRANLLIKMGLQMISTWFLTLKSRKQMNKFPSKTTIFHSLTKWKVLMIAGTHSNSWTSLTRKTLCCQTWELRQTN